MARYGDLGTQYFDDAGDPLVNGKVFFYETGTTTLKTTYADVDFAIPNTNPVILTAAGRQPNIFFDGVAKAILATSAGTQILVRDPVGDTAESFGNPWIASKRYSANDVVQGSDGQYYVSLINGNVNNNPVTTTGNWTFLYSVEWSAGTTYKEGSVITYQNLLYQSLQNSNINKNPLTETTYWVLISLAYVSTTTYTAGQNVVGPDGVFYTALRTTIGDTPASSPSDWVGTSAAAAASATAALASQVAAAASAATATTQASNASASAATATTQAGLASSSASAASSSASSASSSASSATSSASSATASAASATSSASSATSSASSATSSAATATTQAGLASSSAATATTEAGLAAGSAADALASENAAASSAATATTKAAEALSSASTASSASSTATTQAGLASGSAATATTKAAEAVASAATASSNAAAAANSAASAAEIVNISSVTTFTNPLARAVQVAITAATSASNGIQQLTNTQNNFGTGNFALQWRGSVPDWTPAANVILLNKHDGTNGYILTLLTTGFLRLTINATNFDSTVVTGMTDNYVAMIDVDITAATTTAAGSVVFTLNGVQLGTTLVISARVEKITNGTFDTDLTGWTLATAGTGTIVWNANKMRVTRTGGSTSGYQAISLAAGETLYVKATITAVSGASVDAKLSLRAGTSVTSTLLLDSNEILNGASGTAVLSYYSASAQTVYIHAFVYGADGVYDFDDITSLDSATVDNTSSLYVCGTSAVRSASQWFSHRLFNRAKTVAENLGMFVNGVAAADVGASNVAPVAPSFVSGADGYTIANSTAAFGQTIGGETGWLQLTATSTTATTVTRTAFYNFATAFAKGLRFGMDARFYIPSSNVGTVTCRHTTDTASTADSRRLTNVSAVTTNGTGNFFTTTDLTPTEDAVCSVVGSVSAKSTNEDDFRITVNGLQIGDIAYVKFSVVQIGITSELLASNAQSDTGQVLDSSGNKQHALLPAAGASIMGAISARRREVRWTNTWSATSELQYVGGVNQAIFPTNQYIDSLIVIPEGATLTGFTIGNGSNASYYATVNGTITSGVAIYVQLDRRVTDGTNLKLTITPMGAFTGNINTTLVGTELERR